LFNAKNLKTHKIIAKVDGKNMKRLYKVFQKPLLCGLFKSLTKSCFLFNAKKTLQTHKTIAKVDRKE
jgi:hypothetical protein